MGQTRPFGESGVTRMPLEKNGRPEYCLACVGQMAIKCAWCGKTIRVGYPVTLYMPGPSSVVPNHAVPYDADPRRYVGCLHAGCAESGADRSGFWMPPGKVERVPTPYEMLMAGGAPPRGVIVDNVNDPNDIGRLL